MIVCVSPNPALDRTLVVPNFVPGQIRRPESFLLTLGSKGANVARAVRNLGGQSCCVGFLAGMTGRMLADIASAEGMDGRWVWVQGESRNCIIIVDPPANGVTVLNELGPTVSLSDWDALCERIRQSSLSASAVCLSGSLPPGVPVERYADFIRELVSSGQAVWVDTSGAALRAVLDIEGVRVKVNGEEAGEILGMVVADPASAIQAAHRIVKKEIVVLTLGAQGAVMSHPAGDWYARPPALRVVSALGSGDSFLAGLALSLASDVSPGDSLADAVAAGAANALSLGAAHFTREQWHEVRSGVSLQSL